MWFRKIARFLTVASRLFHLAGRILGAASKVIQTQVGLDDEVLA